LQGTLKDGGDGRVLKVERRAGAYHDSIVLMHASRRMLDTPGVEAAMAAMASDLNLRMLRDSGLWEPALEGAGQDELILAARGTDPEAAIRAADAALSEQPPRRRDWRRPLGRSAPRRAGCQVPTWP
jgi:FdrA protein